MASVTVNLTGYSDFISTVFWFDAVSLGSTFALDGNPQSLTSVELVYAGSSDGRVTLRIDGDNNRFTAAFEATGRIIFEASDGETLEVTIGNADMAEPYSWTPTNSADVIAFANHVRGLTDQNATLTLTDEGEAITAPSFQGATGTPQIWTQNQAIVTVSIRPALGNPTPTYAVVGSLPAGLSFNTSGRRITGTPTAVGTGTITVRASNSEGFDDWTVTYTTLAVGYTGPFTITIPSAGWTSGGGSLRWNSLDTQENIPLPAFLNAAGTDEIYLGVLAFQTDGQISLFLNDTLVGASSPPGPEFADQMAMSGTITMVASRRVFTGVMNCG